MNLQNLHNLQHLHDYLTIRLELAEELAQQGVIPGQQDTYELEQMIGRIKEMKHLQKKCKEYLDEL